ncbi:MULTISPECIES: response regulator transcription factor [Deefgea]|uniref:Response regulator n=1 Tax=Deefgea chitinilytica TaxID=570276 RepID=A0ABS2CDD8_9NEIS|nr:MULTISPECIES: response regulator transcription factor [Deefgea]MBM5571690.1 response regulator [Deefgea chitinilytica]MBM9888925.1 response regulator transcription factor [Deefgea sp. CFH1-16]
MPARILLLEDDADIAANVYDYLAARDYQVDAALNGAIALHLLEQHVFDVLVVDIGLPGISGLEVAQRVRTQLKLNTPILLLTARDTLDDKVAGFGAGADDYLVKPFALKELELRIQALRKRSQGQMIDSIMRCGELSYDPRSGEAHWQGQVLKLPPKTLQLLLMLLAHSGQLVTRESLEIAVWGEAQDSSDTLRHHLSQLRRALTLADGRSPLQTVHGRGYKLIELGTIGAP